jgi:hypothetical protein
MSELVSAAQEAWEVGHAILCNLANEILRANGVDQTVEVPKPPLPEDCANALFAAYLTTVKHLDNSTLSDKFSALSGEAFRPEREQFWLLGDWPITNELRKLDEDRGQLPANHIPRTVRVIGSRPRWNEADWLGKFVGPMRENARQWRNWFEELQSPKRKRVWDPQSAEPIIQAYLMRAHREQADASLRQIERDTMIPKSTIARTDAWKTLGSDPRKHVTHSFTLGGKRGNNGPR